MHTVIQDFRFGLRMLRRSPGSTVAAILILALGIGGVTAMFSTLYTVMIQPLPYPQPARLVLGRATYNGAINPWLSGPDYVDYRDQTRSFSALEAFFCNPFDVTLTVGRSADRTRGLIVSQGLFGALGVKMSLGRSFLAEEGEDNGPPVVILSHACWQKHFAGQTDIVGHSVSIDGTARTVVGVMPRDFHFIDEVDVWLPLRPQDLGPRRFNNWYILGRLKHPVRLAEAQSEVDVIAARLGKAYPDTNTNKALLLTPLQGAFTEQYHASFGLLCGGTVALLLIASLNAAGLLLARGAARHGELALRAAIGASPWRLMRLLLTEALILAGLAGVAGTVMAVWIQNGLLALMPIETLLLRDLGLSVPVLMFVLAATLLTGIGSGLLPAWRARCLDPAQDLKSGSTGPLRQGVRLRRALVAGQVTVSFILLVIAGLLIRSFTSLHQGNPGFNFRNLLTVEVSLPPGEYPDAKRTAFFAALLENVRSLPGVASAGAISQLPVRDPYSNIGIYAADTPPTNPAEGADGYQRVVLPGYFGTMQIPLLAGRDLRPTDTSDSARVVIVSQQLAQALFPNRDALGQRVVIDQDSRTPWEIVGVVGDVKQSSLREEPSSRGTFYRAHGQQALPNMRLAIRTSGNPLTVVAPLQALLRKMDPGVPLSGPRTMATVLADSTISERARAVCVTTFSLLAALLAAAGIYGLVAFVVTRRQREVGIRMALGATCRDIAWAIMREALALALAGVCIGGLGALAATRLIRASLYGVGPGDPITFALAALVLVVVAALAAWLPARRAAKVDPMVALRCE